MSTPGCSVSVIMPAFNAETYVASAVESVLSQNFEGLELIVVNDGSSDGTGAVLAGFSNRPGVRILSHPENANRGVCASRRLALREAQGEFIAFLDADDRYLPGKLARHIALLRADPRVVLVHGPVISESEPAARDPGTKMGFVMGSRSKTYELASTSGLLECNRICNSTVVCRHSAVSPEDLPDSMVFQFEDWVLWSQAATRGAFRYEPQPLTVYRQHPDSFSRRQSQHPGAWELAHIEYLATVIGRLPKSPGRRQASKILLAEFFRLARMRNDPGGGEPYSPSYGRVLTALLQSVAADWLRQCLRSGFLWKMVRKWKWLKSDDWTNPA